MDQEMAKYQIDHYYYYGIILYLYQNIWVYWAYNCWYRISYQLTCAKDVKNNNENDKRIK